MRPSEAIVAAIETLIRAALPQHTVEREREDAERVEGGPHAIIRPEDLTLLEVTLSPLIYTYAHAVRVELISPGATRESRTASQDDAVQSVSQAVQLNRSLGGLCSWLEAEPGMAEDEAGEGTETLRLADFVLTATFDTRSPLA